MASTNVQDWIFWVVGGLMAAAGAWLAVWAVFWDRSRGRRRCPSCWYSMEGVADRCPECGWGVVSERALLKTRRRWACAVGGLVLLVFGVGSVAQPTMLRRGKLSLVPTSVLVTFAPGPDEENVWDAKGSKWVEHPVSAELGRRIDSEEFWGWQWRVLLERARVVRTRERWPTDRPLAVAMRTPLWAGRCEITAKARLQPGGTAKAGSLFWEMCGNAVDARLGEEAYQIVGRVGPGTRSVAFDVTVRRVPRTSGRVVLIADSDKAPTLWTGCLDVPVHGVARLDDACAPVRSTELDALLRATLVAKAGWHARGQPGEGAAVWMHLDPARLGARRGLAVGVRAELVRDGRVVEVRDTVLKRDKWRRDKLSHGAIWFNELDRASAADPAQRAAWSVRLYGDGAEVLREWESREYWAGMIEYPLAEIYSGPY